MCKSARDSLLDGAQLVSGLPPPHVQHLVLPGNNGYFALRGQKIFLPLAVYLQHRTLAETSSARDTDNSFVQKTRMQTAQFFTLKRAGFCFGRLEIY